MCCSGLFSCHDSVFVIVAHYRAGLQQTGKVAGFEYFSLPTPFTFSINRAILLHDYR